MADAPPTYDPHGQWERGERTPVEHPAGSYGARPWGSAVSGGGFEYDEATLHDLAKQWLDMAAEFETDYGHATVLARTQGPGQEYASGGNAELIRASGDALGETLLARISYCKNMAAKFVAALGKYATAEEQHAREITKPAGGVL